MKTAIDTSVLHSIYNNEPNAIAWMDLLVKARQEGQMVICDIVYAEFSPAFSSQDELHKTLEALGVLFEPLQPAAAYLAGQTFAKYRKAGGPRAQMIPDFLIAAHAKIQADRLATMDNGFARAYFRNLPLLTP